MPRQVAFFEKTKVKKISAGGFHTLALTVANQLFIWGAEMFGDMNNLHTPKLIPLPQTESKRPLPDSDQLV